MVFILKQQKDLDPLASGRLDWLILIIINDSERFRSTSLREARQG